MASSHALLGHDQQTLASGLADSTKVTNVGPEAAAAAQAGSSQRFAFSLAYRIQTAQILHPEATCEAFRSLDKNRADGGRVRGRDLCASAEGQMDPDGSRWLWLDELGDDRYDAMHMSVEFF